jgi:uncharacterized membrane protein
MEEAYQKGNFGEFSSLLFFSYFIFQKQKTRRERRESYCSPRPTKRNMEILREFFPLFSVFLIVLSFPLYWVAECVKNRGTNGGEI